MNPPFFAIRTFIRDCRSHNGAVQRNEIGFDSLNKTIGTALGFVRFLPVITCDWRESKRQRWDDAEAIEIDLNLGDALV